MTTSIGEFKTIVNFLVFTVRLDFVIDQLKFDRYESVSSMKNAGTNPDADRTYIFHTDPVKKVLLNKTSQTNSEVQSVTYPGPNTDAGSKNDHYLS